MVSTAKALPAPRLPDGPKGKLWQTWRYFREPEEAILSNARKYGETFTMPSLFGPIVVTGTPENVRAIFGADSDTFAPLGAESMEPILGAGSILLQHGAQHRRSRKLLQPPFHGARMRAYGKTMQESTVRHFAAAPVGKPFAIEDRFRDISLDIIIRTVFGVNTGERVARTRKGILDGIAAFSPLIAIFTFLRREFGGIGPWARFRRLLGDIHQLLRDEIHAHQDSPGEDILSLLVAARDEEGRPMDEQEIIDQLFTMVVAGHETTATALAWAVDELYRAPEILSRLRDELGTTGGDPDQLTTAPLLDAVCNETLRAHPLIPMVSRRTLRPFALGDRELPTGTAVAASILVAHHRPDVFPEPRAFRPERFLGQRTFTPHEFFPFGGGVKRCLGAAMAMFEMKIVLGTLVLRADLTLANKKRARPGVRPATVGPKGGVPIVLQKFASA